MLRRTLLKAMVASVIALGLPRSVYGQTPEGEPTPVPPSQPELPNTILQRKATFEDILASARRTRESGLLPGAASLSGASVQAWDPGGDPHYFGPYANYANSPVPRGGVERVELLSGGRGYSAGTTVEILDAWGVGSGALAAPVISGGVITRITITNPGTNYAAPVVSITDATGSGALAEAFIGPPFTGGIRKFVDSLPGLGWDNRNNRDEFIPLAVPDTTTYPGADYYEIELGEFEQQLHSDMPPTKLRGYRQVNSTDPNVNTFHYLGPQIIASRDKPVRVLFRNSLPTGAGGDLFIPVDKTIMGAGMGPVEESPGMWIPYTENRAGVHLHGGATPWISDGTPHQWTTPAGETTPYPEGVSVRHVPDMPEPGPGEMTLFYSNQQSARLMFYHDHTWGITRLNVYVGMVAGYLLTDDVEQDLINGTNNTGVNPELLQALPGLGIPLIIQDKTFVDAETIQAQDPTWNWNLTPEFNPITGSLWQPHIYMPIQNPWDPTGVSAFGRWHYNPWFWPPVTNIDHGPVPNEFFGTSPWEPPMRPQMPKPSMGMEAFNDSTLVNGQLYPYLEVEPRVYRFRILNGANDRFFNLSFFLADPAVVTDDGRTHTEVKLVPAAPTLDFPETWAIDGREGGVPDPADSGPDWVIIGSEGGFLPAPVVYPPNPITYIGDPGLFNVGNVEFHSLLLGPAERADVLVDFSQFAGQTLILYNDAPAPYPANDARYDLYTGNPNLMDAGGAPTVQAGYGPATRTVMQVRVGAGSALGTGVERIAVVNPGTGYSKMPLVDITGGGGSGAAAYATGSVDKISVLNSGSGFGPGTEVRISGGGGSGAEAVANVSNGRLMSITVINGGWGYTSAPLVELVPGPFKLTLPLVSGGGGPQNAPPPPVVQYAQASLKVSAIIVTDGGTGYTSVPTVTLYAGGGTGATATAYLPSAAGYNVTALEAVWAKTPSKRGVFERAQGRIIIPQAAYNSAYDEMFPDDDSQWVHLADTSKTFFNGPLPGLTLTSGGAGYSSVPDVVISGGGGSGAAATAVVDGGVVTELILTNPGTGYTSAPTVAISGGGGSGASALANGITIPLQPKALHDEPGEVYDLEYGRMSGAIGLEVNVNNPLALNMVSYAYPSPPVELMQHTDLLTPLGAMGDGTQIWKINHNGVDEHPMHVHLYNVQLINRVAWDGFLMPPEPHELGWKETIRVRPLEQLIFAFRPTLPTVPFEVPNSIRLMNPGLPEGALMRNQPIGFIDPQGVATTIYNHKVNYGHEFVWHCHILSHEEMDMMHAIALLSEPPAPDKPAAAAVGSDVLLAWPDVLNATSYWVQRSDAPTGPWTDLATDVPVPAVRGDTVTYDDLGVPAGTWYYRVLSRTTVGDTGLYDGSLGYPTLTADSQPSEVSGGVTIV